ncbi:MAG: rhomboid family intramembrane serine protease [bacterium]|jgi:membrane associated rhomboid family serine protease|nr:rhomboid family intramembrane serine protease [bacterium]
MSLEHRIEGWRELDPMARPGPVLRGLMLALAAVYLLQGPLELERWAILRPEEALLQGRLWQLLSYALLHQGLLHLLFNLLGLWVFGTELERVWGSRPFLYYLVFCAVGAGLAHSLIDPFISGEPVGVAGASGAVYGLMAAYGLLFRSRKLFFLGIIPVRAGVLALGFAALAIFSGVFQSGDGVAHVAHLGGMISGLGLLLAAPVRNQWRLWRHRRRMLRHLRRKGGNDPSPATRIAPGADLSRIEARLDELLDKVSRQGLEALTGEERAFLDEASAWLRERRKQGR